MRIALKMAYISFGVTCGCEVSDVSHRDCGMAHSDLIFFPVQQTKLANNLVSIKIDNLLSVIVLQIVCNSQEIEKQN